MDISASFQISKLNFVKFDVKLLQKKFFNLLQQFKFVILLTDSKLLKFGKNVPLWKLYKKKIICNTNKRRKLIYSKSLLNLTYIFFFNLIFTNM